MLGDDCEPEDELHAQLPNGPVSIYVVCDDPDVLFERARARGAEVLQGLKALFALGAVVLAGHVDRRP